jgi:long-chain fatty acid transport protein
MRRFKLLLAGFFLAAITAFGGGYQVGLHGARNIGMGLIGTSLTYDASSFFYNPGAAAFVTSRFSFSGGASILMARTAFQAKDVMYQTTTEFLINTPFYFYGAYKPIENLSIGIAVNTPFGNKLSWGDDWKGKYLIQDISFKAITIQPSFSVKIKDIIGLGFGMVIATGNVEMHKAIPINGPDTAVGKTTITGNTTNIGFNGGILIHPVKGLNIGIDYRSKIMMKVDDGEAKFDVPASMETTFPDSRVSTALPLPANLDFGISYEIKEKFLIGINLCYVFWSVYDSLIFTFQQKTSALDVTATPALYEDHLIARLGLQYKINEVITVRLGGYYDPSPVPDDYLNPQTPSTNQLGLTAGLSVFPIKGFSIDAAFLYVMGAERDATYSPDNFAGTYKSLVYCPSIGLTYNF